MAHLKQSGLGIALSLLLSGDIRELARKLRMRLVGKAQPLPSSLSPLARPAPASGIRRQPASVPLVWMVGTSLNRDGAPISQLELARGLAAQGLRIVAASPVDGPLREEYARAGIRVEIVPELRCSPSLPRRYDSDVSALSFVFRSREPDVILAGTVDSFATVDAAYMAQIPVIWNIRESEPWTLRLADRHPKIAQHALACFRYCASVIFVAEAAHKAWDQFLAPSTAHVIFNAPTPDLLKPAAAATTTEQVRQGLGATAGQLLVVHVGTVCERKGQMDLVRALMLLPEETKQRLRVVFIGRPEGRYADQLIEALQQPALASLARFIGESANAATQIASADILVNTSRSEAFPRTFIEAAVGNTAIVATGIDGARERLRDGDSASFYDPGNSSALAKKLSELVHSPDTITRLAAGARSALVTQWTFEDMIRAYTAKIQDAIKGAVSS